MPKEKKEKDPKVKKTKMDNDFSEILKKMNELEYGEGPIFDDCSDIRRKLNKFFTDKKMSKSAWCNLVGVNSNSLANFLKQKGPDGGAGINVYKVAYHFFEKMRIVEGKKKTKKREEHEQFVTEGFKNETPRTHVWVREGEVPHTYFEHGVRKYQILPK